MAMELVDGVSLAKYVEERGLLPEKEALRLMLHAARGLTYAHEKGLVHRDVKPENLLLGKDGILRLADFGLVHESDSRTCLTTTGTCMGSPMYMSPEQCDGEIADARSDLYSLGASFYRVFTGKSPFSSSTVMGLLFQHKFEAPKDPRLLRPDLSQDVAHLLMSLLQKRRERRPETTRKVVEMIEGLAQGKHIPKPPQIESSTTGSAVEAAPATPRQTIASPPSASKAASQPESFSGLKAAAVLLLTLAVAGGTAFGLYWRFFRDGTDPKQAQNQRLESLLREKLKRATDAERAGNLREAAVLFDEALKIAPDNAEADEGAKRIEKRRLTSEDLKREAEALEKDGRWEEATAAAQKAASLDAALNPYAERLFGMRSFSALRKRAAAEEQAENWSKAADLYEQAAQVAPDSTDAALAKSNAGECRGRAKNKQANREMDLATEKERRFREYLSKGDNALDEELWNAARSYFDAAQKEKPEEAVLIRNKIDGAFARERIAAGDEKRRAGDKVGARKDYQYVVSQWPLHGPPARQRLAELDQEDAKRPGLRERVVDLIRKRDAKGTAAELRSAAQPLDETLRPLQRAVEQWEVCDRIYSEVQQLLDTALARLQEAKKMESDDVTNELLRSIGELKTRFDAKAKLVPEQLLAERWSAAETSLTGARNDANEARLEFRKATGHYNQLAAKYAGRLSVKIPFVKIEAGTNNALKQKTFQRIADDFRDLAQRADMLRQ
jgi:tetratricopeptide (TPR) repeat protein